MIKNIVFDIGNVLVSFGWKDFFGKFDWPADIYERVVNATVKDPIWNEIDRGVLSDPEVLEGFIKNDPGIEKELREMYEDFNGLLTIFEYTEGWILDLRERGYRVYCLSNMSYKAIRECSDAMRFIPMLDGAILSCEVKLIKPDSEIYKFLLDKYSLNPDECIYVDDLEANVRTADELGMHGIVFKDVKQAALAIDKIENQFGAPVAEKEGTYSKGQRVAALIGVIAIGLMFLALMFLIFVRTAWAKKAVLILLGIALVVPILAWVYTWLIGKLAHKHTIADFDILKNLKK